MDISESVTAMNIKKAIRGLEFSLGNHVVFDKVSLKSFEVDFIYSPTKGTNTLFVTSSQNNDNFLWFYISGAEPASVSLQCNVKNLADGKRYVSVSSAGFLKINNRYKLKVILTNKNIFIYANNVLIVEYNIDNYYVGNEILFPENITARLGSYSSTLHYSNNVFTFFKYKNLKNQWLEIDLLNPPTGITYYGSPKKIGNKTVLPSKKPYTIKGVRV